MVMFSTKEGFQLRLIESDPKQEQSAPDHPQRVEEDAGEGGGLDLGEHGHEGDVEEDPDGGRQQPGRKLSSRTQHQPGHLGAVHDKIDSSDDNENRK